MTDPPAQTVPFAFHQVTDTVRNDGNATAGPTKVAYFLSTTPERGPASRRQRRSR